MKRVVVCVAVSMLAIVFLATMFVFGASTTEPDLEVATGDVSFPTPVHVNTSVTISGTVHNTGICYVVLGDSLAEVPLNPDQIAFSFAIPSNIAVKGMKARIRSANDTRLVTAKIWIDDPLLLFGRASSTSATWSEQFFGFDLVLSNASAHNLHVLYEVGGSNTDLHVDWVQLLDVFNGTLLTFEAEKYTGGGDTVDAIRPQNVTLQFYGNATGTETQINGDKTVGDGTNTVGTGAVKYLTAGGSAMASVAWTPTLVGYYNITVKALPDASEEDVNDNQASNILAVYAVLTISVGSPGGTTNATPGTYTVYSSPQTVTAIPSGSYRFAGWVIDTTGWDLANPTVQTMNRDHTVTALFNPPVGGSSQPIDKFGLLTPYARVASAIALIAVVAGLCVKRAIRKNNNK